MSKYCLFLIVIYYLTGGNNSMGRCRLAASGTTGVVAKKLGRRFIGIDSEREYLRIARTRLERVDGQYC